MNSVCIEKTNKRKTIFIVLKISIKEAFLYFHYHKFYKNSLKGVYCKTDLNKHYGDLDSQTLVFTLIGPYKYTLKMVKSK